MHKTQEVALRLIARTPKGDARAKLLQSESFRSLVLNSGANVTLYCGEVQSGDSCKEMLQNVYVGLIQRKNKNGKPDGLGALGGMAERTSREEFVSLTNEQRAELIGQKDDVILAHGMPHLIHRMDIIRRNNVMREMREELDDLGISGEHINPNKLELVEMPKVKDDNYMINIWDGKGPCYAVTPYCHLYKDSEGLIDRLVTGAKEREGGEARGFVKIPLFETLGAYGHSGEKNCTLEDGRDAKKDYRYPHEHLAAWALAARLLENNPQKMVELVKEVQDASLHRISFKRLAKATGQTLSDLAAAIGVTPINMERMERAASEKFTLKCVKSSTDSHEI